MVDKETEFNTYPNLGHATDTVELEQNTNERLKEEKEPLFVEDRTHNFRLNHAIQYKSSPDNSSRSDMGYKQNACWNCSLTDHSLHNCPSPKNHHMISRNRQEFLAHKQQQQLSGSRNNRNKFGYRKNIRYFVEEAQDICSGFTPGKLSDDLLEALNLPKNGIPLHVYKMRKYGYPSGWLQEARDVFSGISIFTSPNECLPLPGKEKGEDNIYYCTLNKRKLHEYPGFNAPCPPETIDEYKKFNCPKYDPDQNLKLMYEKLKNSKLDIKDKKTKYSENEVSTKISTELKDIDLTNNERSLYPKIDEPPSSPEDGEIVDESSDQDEIESDENNSLVPENPINESNPENCANTEESVFDKSSSSNLLSSDSDVHSTPVGVKRKFGEVKSEVLGTPVLKHFSPYEKRPTHAHFAKGMVDMIDHENLPNAVGTFEKLKEILKDVRKTMNNLI